MNSENVTLVSVMYPLTMIYVMLVSVWSGRPANGLENTEAAKRTEKEKEENVDDVSIEETEDEKQQRLAKHLGCDVS